MAIVTSILFIIAFISYISGALLCPIGRGEQRKTVQGFQTIIYQCIVLMNITAFAAVIFNKVHIPITLFTTSVFILFLSGILWGIILYKKEKNVIFWSKTDGISMAILIIVVGFISAKMFNFSLEVTYPIQDAAFHFVHAMDIINQGVLIKYPFAPYVNSVFMQVFQPFFEPVQIYKTFILSDIIFHILEILVVYSIFAYIGKGRIAKATNLVFTFLYFMGYPYLCFSYGFVRQQRAILLIVGLVLHIMREKNGIVFDVLVFIQLFNILESYPIYLLQAGLLVGIYFCVLYRKKICHFLKSNMGKIVAISCMLIGTVGVYIVYLKFDTVKNSLSEAGGTYFSPYSDLIYFIPPMILVIAEMRKAKKTRGSDVICASVIISCVIVTLGEFVLWWNGVMSSYYYYKSYSLLWFAGWMSGVCAIEIMVLKEGKKEILFYGSFLFILWLVQYSKINAILIEKNSSIENGSMRANYYSLFEENFLQVFAERKNYFSNNLEDIATYIIQHYPYSKICYITTYNEKNSSLWFCGITNSLNYELDSTLIDMNALIEIGDKRKIDYFLVNKQSSIYLNNKEIIENMEETNINDMIILLKNDMTER